MPAAAQTCVSFANFAQVGEPRLVVPAGLNASEVDVVAVGADDVLTLAQRFIREHVDRGPDRSDRAAAGTERLADLLWLRRPEVLPERLEKLHLVEAVVAAHEGEDDAPAGDDGHRLGGGPRVETEELRHGLDRPLPG